MALGRKAYMAYIAEGLADVLEWDDVQKYQRKNGSLFNSPSATSAFAIHTHNTNALKYLEFLGNKFVDSGVYFPETHC
jgi:ent-kaurene synthase